MHHGDFAWPDIAPANWIMRRYGAQPWCIGADGYERLATRGPPEGIPPHRRRSVSPSARRGTRGSPQP
ncbi:DUF2399 domain-containing protein [Streptomyces sp. NPDC007002]|uniref:DUF2399 domain-containing protein n=1 Tax=Streptomyces sp. NPDC007002 TaxID=3156910 RepID=UPI003452A1E2